MQVESMLMYAAGKFLFSHFFTHRMSELDFHVMATVVVVFFHGLPWQTTDVLQPSWLFCTARFGTFQLWPLGVRAPTDASRTPAAKGGTYGRGIGPEI
jgi:hypothetical protein